MPCFRADVLPVLAFKPLANGLKCASKGIKESRPFFGADPLKHISVVSATAATAAAAFARQYVQFVKRGEVSERFFRRAASSLCRFTPLRPHILSFEPLTAASKDSDQTSDGRREACDEANNADDDRRERSKQTSKCRAKLVLHREACGCDSVEALCKLTTRNLVELVGVLQALLEPLRNGLDDATQNTIERNALERSDEVLERSVGFLCRIPNFFRRLWNLGNGFRCRCDVAKPVTSFFDVGEVNSGNLSQNNGNVCKPFGVIGKFCKPVCERANAFCRIAHFFERLQCLGKLAEYRCRAAQGQI